MRESLSLDGKVVVQIGGSGLLGRAMARDLAAVGADLVIASRNPANVAGSVAAGQQAGHKISTEPVDITDEKSVAALIQTVQSKHGRLDGMVFNAVSRPMAGAASPLEGWRESMRVNADGLYLCLQLFADAMAAQPNGGSIVNISSMMGMVGPNPANYEGTIMGTVPDYFFHKAGMIQLTRYYASLYGLKKVRVNAVSPGGIFNTEKPQADAFIARYNKMTMLGRMADAPEVSGSVIFLLSDASTYVTATNIPVDGGYTAK